MCSQGNIPRKAVCIRGSNSRLGCYSLPLLLQIPSENKTSTTTRAVLILLVRMTGLDSRANCALGLPRSRTSTGSPLCTDSPSNPAIYTKQNGRATRTLPFHLVQATGFEPTRISSLEPDSNASRCDSCLPLAV